MPRSIQECRETIASNFRAMSAKDGAFFKNINDRMEAFQAKNAHPADFRRLNGEVRAWTAKLAGNVGSSWTDQDQSAYDGALALVDLLDIEVSNRAAASEAIDGRSSNRNPSSGWVNAETGEAVRLYASDEPLAADRSTRIGAPSVGALIAAQLIGTKDQEIRNVLEEGTNSAGGYSVPTYVVPQFIDKLRAKTQLINAGARTMVLDGKTRIVRTDTDPTAAWRSESGTVNVSDAVFSPVDLVPQDLAVLVKLSREVFADSVNIQAAVESAIIGAMSVELDRAGMFGSGTLPEPKGLFNTSGITTVSMGTNGGTPTNYDDLLDVLYNVELNNASPTAMIWNPRTARTYRKLKDTTNQPLEAPAPLDTLPKLDTNSVPITQTQGTAAGICSTVLMGDFTQAIIGLRESLRIQFLTEKFADVGQFAFVAHLRADFAFEHPASFAALIGVKP